MSGGSYNYLCWAEFDDILDKLNNLQEMADDLAKLGYANDAAQETQNLLLTIRQYENRIQPMIKRLSDVWHDFEWWQDCGKSEDDFKKSLALYRCEDIEKQRDK